jgi:hypothetical protein
LNRGRGNGANGTRTRDLLAASQTLSQLSYGPARRSVPKSVCLPPGPGTLKSVDDKSDYSPVVEETGDAEMRREERKWKAFLWGAHAFWIYALVLAGIVILVLWLA